MENSTELDIINHLLAIEKDASSLINDAQIESEKRISEAKIKYNAEYKEKYDAAVKVLEKEYESELEKIKAAHDKEIKDYENELESSEKNSKAFNEALDKLLFA